TVASVYHRQIFATVPLELLPCSGKSLTEYNWVALSLKAAGSKPASSGMFPGWVPLPSLYR
ncbi:hypothetical protein, partial [Candidatus Erwinia dacicola]|uniref:hypothetical protein n=1 Tax=Candidatus Erwinia dacicola TaxID=252393 RepID=UPI001C9C044B